MFTGIIEEVGIIKSITQNKILIEASKILEDAKIGDSIAVNGVCLTLTKAGNKDFYADISPETNKITTLNKLRIGDYVNLERALPTDGRFGGHIVSGHIDGTGILKTIKNNKEFYDIDIELNSIDSKYAVKKGSIAINGISLTIANIYSNTITIAVIPHTYNNTNLKFLRVGDSVNIETDILAKYVEKFLSTSDNKSGISMEFLMENGF